MELRGVDLGSALLISGEKAVGFIYFIQDESINLIRIGYTDALDGWERLRALQTGSPVGLVLLCCVEAGRSQEKDLHRRFAAARERGEWFRPVPGLIRYICNHYVRPSPPTVARPASGENAVTDWTAEDAYRKGAFHALRLVHGISHGRVSPGFTTLFERMRDVAYEWYRTREPHDEFMDDLFKAILGDLQEAVGDERGD